MGVDVGVSEGFDFAGVILAPKAMKPAQYYPFLVRLLCIVVTMTMIIGIFLPARTVNASSSIFGLSFPMSDDQAHITGGIIVWEIIIVIIIFLGVVIGSRGTHGR